MNTRLVSGVAAGLLACAAAFATPAATAPLPDSGGSTALGVDSRGGASHGQTLALEPRGGRPDALLASADVPGYRDTGPVAAIGSAPVQEPWVLLLLGGGLIALALLLRRRE